MKLTWQDVEAHNAKVFAAKFPKQAEKTADDAIAAGTEKNLHREIMEFCDTQWPKWKYIRARMDKKSPLPLGCQDFTIFASCKRVFCIECKTKNEKPDIDQLSWHKEMEMLGHEVHVVRSFAQWKEIVEKSK